MISQSQLNTALHEQKQWGGKLGTILVRMGALSEDLLVKALSKQLGIPRADFEAMNVPPAVLQRLDRGRVLVHDVVTQYVGDLLGGREVERAAVLLPGVLAPGLRQADDKHHREGDGDDEDEGRPETCELWHALHGSGDRAPITGGRAAVRSPSG